MARSAMRLAGAGVALALLFWLALTAVYAIPVSCIQEQIHESQEIVRLEGDYPKSYTAGTGLDNFTTAIMLNEAAYSGGEPFLDSLRCRYYLDEDKVAGITESLNGNWNVSYSRYWHGYLVLLKPLLLFFNVEQIRLIFLAIAAMLLSLVSVMLSRRFGKIGIAIGLALTAAWTLVGGFDAASTLPIFFSFAISLCGMLWITVTEKLDLTRAGFAFFLIGAVTVFFDFFDNPILTLGMPLVVYVLREHCEHRLSGRSCLRVLALCAMWALGYAGLWAFKWLLVAVFVGPDNLSGLSTAMTMWTGIDSSPLSTAVTPIDAFRSNINGLGWLKYLLALLLIAAVTLVVVCAIRARKRTQRFGSWVGASVILLVIASFPYVWYLVLCGHSYIHSGFICYRDQLLTFFSLSAVVVFSIGMLRSATAAQCPSAGAKTKDAVPLAARESCEGD